MTVILVTGASQGIGAAICRRFAREADSHIVLVSRNVSRMNEVAAACREEGAAATVVQCDVTDAAEVEDMRSAVAETIGVPDVLVNNAGIFRPGGIVDLSVEDFRDQVEVNLTSAFAVTKAFLNAMVDRRSGHLFYMASVASIRAYAGGAAYCAAKHGLLGLSRVVREETRESGLRVTAVMPGATWTPSWEASGLSEDRMIKASDIADVVADAWRLPASAVVEEVLVRPQLGDI